MTHLFCCHLQQEKVEHEFRLPREPQPLGGRSLHTVGERVGVKVPEHPPIWHCPRLAFQLHPLKLLQVAAELTLLHPPFGDTQIKVGALEGATVGLVGDWVGTR